MLAVDNLSPIETSALFHENLFANNADALYNKGVDLHNLGRYEEATTYYDKGLAIDPNNIEALNGKGTTLHDLGEYNFLHH